jgi:hypothetical protein
MDNFGGNDGGDGNYAPSRSKGKDSASSEPEKKISGALKKAMF